MKDWLYLHDYCEWKIFRWFCGGRWTHINFGNVDKSAFSIWCPYYEIRRAHYSNCDTTGLPYTILKEEMYG